MVLNPSATSSFEDGSLQETTFPLKTDLHWLSQRPIVVQVTPLSNIPAPGETQSPGKPRERAAALHQKFKSCLFLRVTFNNWSVNEEALSRQ